MKKNLLAMASLAICFISQGQITFTDESALLTSGNVSSSHPCAIFDMNGDGLDDIIRLDGGTNLYVNYQESDGSFTEFEFGTIEDSGWGGDAWGMCVGDLNNDGYGDIVAGGAYDDIKTIFSSATNGVFTLEEISASGIFVQAINLFDIDNDGDLDIFACHDDGPSQLLRNDGTGNFTEGMEDVFDSALYPSEEENAGNYGSVWSDVNGDKRTDCYIAKCRQGVTDPTDVRRINQYWVQGENGVFDEQGAEAGIDSGWQSWSADFADIDNDGDMDLFVGNHDFDNQLFLNQGNGVFTDISVTSGIDEIFSSIVIQSIFRDFDNDGFIDLLITGGNQYVIARNNGDLTFSDAGNSFGTYGMNSFACGDLNHDGFVDVYATEGGYGSFGADDADRIYMNTPNDNYWINIELVSTESAPDGVGAVIYCTIDGITQMREIRCGESYGIQNSNIVTVGFGAAEEAYPQIMVYWPSGIIDSYVGVIGSTATITEGMFPVSVDETVKTGSLLTYPNPSRNEMTVQIDSARLIQVYDSSGMLVKQINANTAVTKLEKRDFASGVYQLVVTDSSGARTSQRIIFE